MARGEAQALQGRRAFVPCARLDRPRLLQALLPSTLGKLHASRDRVGAAACRLLPSTLGKLHASRDRVGAAACRLLPSPSLAVGVGCISTSGGRSQIGRRRHIPAVLRRRVNRRRGARH